MQSFPKAHLNKITLTAEQIVLYVRQTFRNNTFIALGISQSRIAAGPTLPCSLLAIGYTQPLPGSINRHGNFVGNGWFQVALETNQNELYRSKLASKKRMDS